MTYVKPKDAWRHRQGSASMKRFAGLSLIPASQFVARVSLLFAFPSSALSLVAISTTHCTVHMSDMSVA